MSLHRISSLIQYLETFAFVFIGLSRCYMLDFSIYLKRYHFTREQIEWAGEMWNVSKDKKMHWKLDHWSRFPSDPEHIPEHFSNRFFPFSEPLLGILLTYQRSADIIWSKSHTCTYIMDLLMNCKELNCCKTYS